LHDGVPQLVVGQLNLYERTQHDNYPHITLQSQRTTAYESFLGDSR
jgi:hypothetical protein